MASNKDSAILPGWWNLFPWILAMVVIGVGFTVWFETMSFTFKVVSLYQVFPIIGILAWSIMWTHFIVGEIRRLIPSLPKHKPYHRTSTAIVIWLVLLHPMILAIEQLRQGFGLPPLSYFAYAGEARIPYVILGMLGLTGFLFFEVIARFKENPKVVRLWWLVNFTQTIAMASIFYHALVLGSDMHSGWFRSYWIVLGLLLTPCLVHQHWEDLKNFKK